MRSRWNLRADELVLSTLAPTVRTRGTSGSRSRQMQGGARGAEGRSINAEQMIGRSSTGGIRTTSIERIGAESAVICPCAKKWQTGQSVCGSVG